MTRKDYAFLAADLASCRPYIAKRSTREQRACYDVWHRARWAVVQALQADNPSFDKDKFIEATEK